MDEGTKTVVVKSADGTEKTFEYTENAGKDVGNGVTKGTGKGCQGDGLLPGRGRKEGCALFQILVVRPEQEAR